MRNETLTKPVSPDVHYESHLVKRIKAQISSAPIVLYMKGTPDFPECGFSARVVDALRSCGAQFAHHNIYEDPEVRQVLKIYSNWPTFPQLYVNGVFLGGCDIVMDLHQSGELRPLLMDVDTTSV